MGITVSIIINDNDNKYNDISDDRYGSSAVQTLLQRQGHAVRVGSSPTVVKANKKHNKSKKKSKSKNNNNNNNNKEAINTSLTHERHRAEAALYQTQQELQTVRDELNSGRELLRSLLMNGEKDLRAHTILQQEKKEKEEQFISIPLFAVPDASTLNSPVPRPPLREFVIDDKSNVVGNTDINTTQMPFIPYSHSNESEGVETVLVVGKAHNTSSMGEKEEEIPITLVREKKIKKKKSKWSVEIVNDDTVGPWGDW
ncbi:hypothetical protein LSM04_001631 [Trypanosoma melophagium]|uniref:uncharacterized protein n=1 Tax=Trypanosoma melophagium TaxID=715481 RepID=UPI00351A18A0|nr:hypothetical protein LSM04_001631 [Trypanosoma melophagium]